MQIHRLFEMVYLLLDRRRMTAGELAERFEVSERTIYRDVEVLSSAGIPVYASKGRGGGISLLDHFVLDKSVLSEREKSDILSALQGMAAAQYPDIDEVLARLSGLFRQENTAWIDVDFTQWGSDEQDKQTFRLLRDAILANEKVAFSYCSANGERTCRTVEPLRLQFKGRAWYLQGFCLTRQELRVFKIARMSNVELTGEKFAAGRTLPPFEGEAPAGVPMTALCLRFSPAISHRVYDEFQREAIAREPDGSLRVNASFLMDEWVYGYLLSFGGDLEVIGPEPVRSGVARRIERARKVYQEI